MSTRDTEGQREDFYRTLEPHHMAPLWTRLKALVPREPATLAVPHRWKYDDVRPLVMASAGHISAAEAERRVLILENPAMGGASQITSTLYAGLQLIMPGEVAPAHRHTQSALRFIVEGSGAYTTVDDEKVPMEPGDFVITPPWRWHLHGNESSSPMVWLDGLDIPMAAHFNSTFREDHAERRAEPSKPGGPVSYPYREARGRLDALGASGAPDIHRGHVLDYRDPATGDWAMPTIAATLRLLPGGLRTRPYRSSDGLILAVVEGSGRIEAGGDKFEVGPRDIAVLPGWVPYTVEADGDLVLFGFSDRAAQEKLGFFREQRL
ncbi:MAG TPA: cupin domain-containing protein [Usitatibacter sp.]|nr:cupin domain-containing protein [Usitatibacter sp.]